MDEVGAEWEAEGKGEEPLEAWERMEVQEGLRTMLLTR